MTANAVPVESINEFLLACIEVFPSACGVMGKVGDEEALRIRARLFQLMGDASNLHKWAEAAAAGKETPTPSDTDQKQPKRIKKSKTESAQEYSGKHATHNNAGTRNGR